MNVDNYQIEGILCNFTIFEDGPYMLLYSGGKYHKNVDVLWYELGCLHFMKALCSI